MKSRFIFDIAWERGLGVLLGMCMTIIHAYLGVLIMDVYLGVLIMDAYLGMLILHIFLGMFIFHAYLGMCINTCLSCCKKSPASVLPVPCSVFAGAM